MKKDGLIDCVASELPPDRIEI